MIFNFLKTKKAQSALEYLLIVGGAILIAVIVIVLMTGMNRSRSETLKDSEESYQQMVDQTIINPLISDVVCTESEIKVYISPSPTKGVNSYCLVLDDSIDNSNCEEYDSSDGSVEFTETLTLGDTHSVALVARKNDGFSSVSKPSMSCTVE